jgi:hypothetical protein
VNILEETEALPTNSEDHLHPPSRSYSVDEISIPSPIICTPTDTPPVFVTPTAGPPFPNEPLPTSTGISESVVNSLFLVNTTATLIAMPASPASVRSVRGNSITFSSSRSPSPAYSNPLSMASSAQDAISAASPAGLSEQDDASSVRSFDFEAGTTVVTIASRKSQETPPPASEAIQINLKIPVSEVDPSLLMPKIMSKLKTTVSFFNHLPAFLYMDNFCACAYYLCYLCYFLHFQGRVAPTAIINKMRPPRGDVNIERSMEIVRSAVEKSSTPQHVQVDPHQNVIRQMDPQQQPHFRASPVTSTPMPTIIRAQQQRPATMNNAVLVTTADGKTILAHPTGQLFRQFRPTTSTVASNNIRLRLPTSLASHGMTNAPVTLQLQQQQPHQQVRPMQQVCFVQQPGQRPMFRMPTSTSSTSTVVLDASQLSGLIVSS